MEETGRGKGGERGGEEEQKGKGRRQERGKKTEGWEGGGRGFDQNCPAV